jgi:hypothetical protein
VLLAPYRLIIFSQRCGVIHFRGSQLHTIWLQVLGSQIPYSAVVQSANVSEMDLLHFGANAVVDEGAAARGTVLNAQKLILGTVHVGCGAQLRSYSYARPGGTVVEDRTEQQSSCSEAAINQSETSDQGSVTNKGIVDARSVLLKSAVDLCIAVGFGFLLVAASIPAYFMFGELAEGMGIIPKHPSTHAFVVDYRSKDEGYYITSVVLLLPYFFIPFICTFLHEDLLEVIKSVATEHKIHSHIQRLE